MSPVEACPVPCGGCIRRQCPDLCRIDNDDNERPSARATSHETTSASTSRLFASDGQNLGGFEGERLLASDYMTFPSVTAANTRSASRDRTLERHLGNELANGNNLSNKRDAAPSNPQPQHQHLRLEEIVTAGPSKPPGLPRAQSMESGPSANVGSLRLDTGGRSRYFGPTAASQWLRDVSLYSSFIAISKRILSRPGEARADHVLSARFN
jgi:hypothetical protein